MGYDSIITNAYLQPPVHIYLERDTQNICATHSVQELIDEVEEHTSLLQNKVAFLAFFKRSCGGSNE